VGAAHDFLRGAGTYCFGGAAIPGGEPDFYPALPAQSALDHPP